MKKTLIVLTTILAATVAQATDNCSRGSELMARKAYLAAIQSKAKLADQFEIQRKELAQDFKDSDTMTLNSIRAICIAQGASMHAGVVSSRETFLLVHKMRAGGGVVNDSSLLAVASVTENDGKKTVENIGFTELK